MTVRSVLPILTLSVVATACATHAAHDPLECRLPDAALAGILEGGDEASACRADIAACDGIRHRLNDLALVCPAHVPTQMAIAALAADAHDFALAEAALDRVLSTRDPGAAAAALRAQVAIEVGNLPFARRLLREQVAIHPDDPMLREVQSALLYLTGDYDAARLELLVARALGAPAGRVAYHQGLVEETSGHPDIAVTYYRDALAADPDFGRARARLTALTPARQP